MTSLGDLTFLRALQALDVWPVLLSGLLYAVFSRLWFTYMPWSRHYHGAFSEKFIGPYAKRRSAVIRFIAGSLMGALVGLVAVALQLKSVSALLSLGAFISVGFVAVSLVQFFSSRKGRRPEIFSETLFQLIAIAAMCLLWAVTLSR